MAGVHEDDRGVRSVPRPHRARSSICPPLPASDPFRVVVRTPPRSSPPPSLARVPARRTRRTHEAARGHLRAVGALCGAARRARFSRLWHIAPRYGLLAWGQVMRSGAAAAAAGHLSSVALGALQRRSLRRTAAASLHGSSRLGSNRLAPRAHTTKRWNRLTPLPCGRTCLARVSWRVCWQSWPEPPRVPFPGSAMCTCCRHLWFVRKLPGFLTTQWAAACAHGRRKRSVRRRRLPPSRAHDDSNAGAGAGAGAAAHFGFRPTCRVICPRDCVPWFCS